MLHMIVLEIAERIILYGGVGRGSASLHNGERSGDMQKSSSLVAMSSELDSKYVRWCHYRVVVYVANVTVHSEPIDPVLSRAISLLKSVVALVPANIRTFQTDATVVSM